MDVKPLADYQTAPYLVKTKLADFLESPDQDVIATAAIYYGRCLWIHPFQDANGLSVRARAGKQGRVECEFACVQSATLVAVGSGPT